MSETKLTPVGEIIRRMREAAAGYRADGALVNGDTVMTRWAEALEQAAGGKGGVPAQPPLSLVTTPQSWRERLWLVPDECRLGVRELAEAIGRPRSWCYRHTSKKSGLSLIPHRKLDGEVIFVAGEVREWIRAHEDVVVKPLPSVIPLKRGA